MFVRSLGGQLPHVRFRTLFYAFWYSSLPRQRAYELSMGLIKKANHKLHALNRIAHNIDSENLKHVMMVCTFSQISYCPLVWAQQKDESSSCKALRIVYIDELSDLDVLLKKIML